MQDRLLKRSVMLHYFGFDGTFSLVPKNKDILDVELFSILCQNVATKHVFVLCACLQA